MAWRGLLSICFSMAGGCGLAAGLAWASAIMRRPGSRAPDGRRRCGMDHSARASPSFPRTTGHNGLCGVLVHQGKAGQCPEWPGGDDVGSPVASNSSLASMDQIMTFHRAKGTSRAM